MDPIDNTNLIPLIGNNPINMQRIRVDGPSIIPAIDPPVLRSMELPVVRGLEAPIIDVPRPRIPYPVINVPTQQEFDAAVKAEKDKQAQEDAAKTRSLPDTTPPPQLPQVAQTPSTQAPIAEIPADKPQPTFTVYGVNINLPDPSVVATAGAVAVVTTATTMVANVAFNALKNAAEPMLREAAKNKFKIKLKQVKPVLHFVMSEGGNVDIFEYSSEGTKLVGQVDNVEQYLRDQVDSNSLYEVENKVIIDDVISDKFTKEGQKRFKPLFAPAKKIAKKLSSKFSI
jgi:hypothetical protein